MGEALAEGRRKGWSFDRAWREGWRSMSWSSTTGTEWRRALKETRPEWETAFYGNETGFSVTLAQRDTLAAGIADYVAGTQPVAV